MLRVRTPQEYRAKQMKVLKEVRKLGVVAAEIVIDTPVVARIEHNRWLLDCQCGSGVAVTPGWSEARCLGLGCGRVYTNIQIPSDIEEIERELKARPNHIDRNWNPQHGDTVATLRAARVKQDQPISHDEKERT